MATHHIAGLGQGAVKTPKKTKTAEAPKGAIIRARLVVSKKVSCKNTMASMVTRLPPKTRQIVAILGREARGAAFHF